MHKTKSTLVVIFILQLIATATHCADSVTQDELNALLLQHYDQGENRHFYPGMSDCQRYAAYPLLCIHQPCCCVSTPDEGYRLIESYINSQKCTCDGKEITESNFGPRHIQMKETIKARQHDDLISYFASRTADNPERSTANFLLDYSFCLGWIVGEACHIPRNIKAKRLISLLPSEVDTISINKYAETNAPMIAVVATPCSCLCILSILNRAKNL